MRITADTNILIRAVVRDHAEQSALAARLLKEAEIVAVGLSCLCEFVWVLRRVYGFDVSDIHAAITALINAKNVAVNRTAADAGLQILAAGGDFADGVIAFAGAWLGGEAFVSFDKRAVALVQQQGQAARLLA